MLYIIAQQTFQATGGPNLTGLLAQVALKMSSAVVNKQFIHKLKCIQTYINRTAATTTPLVYTVFSLVIEVEDGIVQSIYWDNGCFGSTPCTNNLVDSNNATYSNIYDESCTSIRTTDYLCDPKVRYSRAFGFLHTLYLDLYLLDWNRQQRT